MSTKTERKPIATYTISNTMGVLIYEIDYTDDRVLWNGFSGDKATGRKRWGKIYAENETGRQYFKFGSMKIYFDECMRV